MAQRVLLYAKALPTRLAVQSALETAHIEPVYSSTPADLLLKLQQQTWDVIVLDADSSPIPLAKLLEVVGAHVALTGTVVVALTSQAQPLPPGGEALLYNRPIRPGLLIGAMNRLLLARGKKPILRPTVVLDKNMRRALRVPLLVPVVFRSTPSDPWKDAEARDVSIGGAQIAASGGLSTGQSLNLKNVLTGQEGAFRVVWVGDDIEGIAAGLQGGEQLRFWLPA